MKKDICLGFGCHVKTSNRIVDKISGKDYPLCLRCVARINPTSQKRLGIKKGE